MIEGAFETAVCLAAVNDVNAAITHIDRTLQALRYSTTLELGQIPRTGALVRAMALRAALAHGIGDHAMSQIWARAVSILWSDADAFLDGTVREMKQLAH
jgi:hypothetical protein